MIKVFTTGIVLGLIASGIAAWLLPIETVHRETSLVVVKPNGGVVELFNIDIPADRIIVGPAGDSAAVPGRLKWPQELRDAGVALELFKLRNERGLAVGVASRVATSGTESGPVSPALEWVLHLPARGSMYFPMIPEADGSGRRIGALRAGSKEFVEMSGNIIESFTAGNIDGSGRITLQTTTIKNAAADEEGASP